MHSTTLLPEIKAHAASYAPINHMTSLDMEMESAEQTSSCNLTGQLRPTGRPDHEFMILGSWRALERREMESLRFNMLAALNHDASNNTLAQRGVQ